MTAYQDKLNEYSRTPVDLAVITLDYCGRTFGVSPCLATGTPCYNTYPTCKYRSAYLKQSKDYKFTSAEAPLPWRTNERPYIASISHLPTEIKDSLTVNARLKIKFYDEPDTDMGIDPYVAQRTSAQGTFWKKLLERNRNYKGRIVKTYEGFLGLAEADFQQRFKGRIDNVSREGNAVEIESVDLLKDLSKIEVPPKLDIKLVVDISAAITEITLTDVTGLDSPAGYVRIDDEILYYTGVSGSSKQITGCSRGYFGTTAATHSANGKVQKVRYYAPANPFDILKTMLLTDASMPAGDVNSTEIDYWRDWPGGEVDFSAIISEPVKLSTLYFEVLALVDCKSWVGEDLKVTIRRNIPNEPGRTYRAFTDESGIVAGSAAVDFTQASRLSRAYVYWNKTAIGALDDPASYGRIDLGIDSDAESANDYNEPMEKKIFCRWLRTGYAQEETIEQFVKNLCLRLVWRHRDPMPVVTFSAEIKDAEAKTGDYVRLSTDEVLNPDGTPVDRAVFQIIRREVKGGLVHLKAQRMTPRNIDIIAPDTAPDWASATEADREYGYISDDDGLMPDGTPGYVIFG